jgi:farnesyl diphosphate synthase
MFFGLDPQAILPQIGSDIEDFKCSWLFVQALERADEKQKGVLFENYGKSDPACVAKVKDLYNELHLQVFPHYFCFLLKYFLYIKWFFVFHFVVQC